MTDRKLATIRRISALTPIPDADKIETATVDGWKVVCQKGLYEVGDLCVYLEIDSWVPNEVAPFLTKAGKEPKEYKGVKGERLKTVKLKKQISQGLLLPLSEIPKSSLGYEFGVSEGEDLTEFLGILKWELDIPAQLRGMMKGNFPQFIRKTDQERVQNLSRTIEAWSREPSLWEVTEKLDGSSMTVYLKDGVFGVCSRNIDLKVEDTSNAFVAMALKLKLNESMPTIRNNWAIQGELCGPGIQGNYYELSEHTFFVYDMYDIDNQQYLDCEFTRSMAKHMGLRTVPMITVQTLADETVETILEGCQGISFLINKPAEGVVFKCLDNDSSFKAINNEWLLKNE
jgi:RNA ligase (TIGR02306 family)